MSGRNTYFNSDWLCFKDCNHILISFWCKKRDTFTAFCTFCNASIQTRNQEFLALNQYAKTKTHACRCKDFYGWKGFKLNCMFLHVLVTITA